MARLGGKCVICGTESDLQIDRIFDDGKLDRFIKGDGGDRICLWVLTTKWSHLYVKLLCGAHNLEKEMRARPISLAMSAIWELRSNPPSEHLEALEYFARHFITESACKPEK